MNMRAKDKYIFIYQDKVLDIVNIKDDVTASDLQGMIMALVSKMYDKARMWDK